MKFSTQEISRSRCEVVVTISPEDWQEEEERITQEFAREASIPGFRPGKAPIGMVRSRYLKQIREEVSRKLTARAYEDGVKKGDLKVFGVVDAQGTEDIDSDGGEIRITVDLQPQFDLPAYEGLPATLPQIEVTDEEVQQQIDAILQQRSSFEPVERPAQKGDYVRCGYEGTIDGQPIAELVPEKPIWGTQKVTWEEAGAEESPGVPAVIEGLVGMAAGDTKEVTQEFPSDHEIEALQGKTALYRVEVNEVRQRLTPELDDDLAKSLGTEGADDLREKIREDLEQRKESENHSSLRSQITRQLVEQVDMEPPESAIEEETQGILRDFIQRQMAQGVPQEAFEERREELFNQARTMAEGRVRTRFLLARIAEKENLRAETQDLSMAVYQQAMQEGTPPEKLAKEIRKDEDRLASLQRDVIFRKTLDLLAEKATVTFTPPGEQLHSPEAPATD